MEFMHWNLLRYRKQLNYTQKDMADKLNISTNSYGKKEKGLTLFKENEMIMILKLLLGKNIKTNLEELFL